MRWPRVLYFHRFWRNAMQANQLVDQLNAANLRTVVLRGSGGSEIVVTPHGARVMGIFTRETGENLYFVNAEFDSAPAAKTMLAGEHMLGGDRMWIAPERGLFFKGDAEKDGQVIQPGIDPGNWVVAKLTDRSIKLVNEFSATYFHKSGSVIRGVVERSIRRIASPFYHVPDALPTAGKVNFVGYEIASRFDLLESPQDDLHFGMWFLIQLTMKDGGYFYAPTSGKTVITDYYEPTGDDYLRVAENHVRFKLDSKNRHKIGIRKTEVTGKMGYLSEGIAGESTLIIRNFLNNPSGYYSDVPLHTPAGTQDAIQSYNHNTGTAGFGEMEFHAPGVNRAMPEPSVTDVNQLWAFTGKREDLVPI